MIIEDDDLEKEVRRHGLDGISVFEDGIVQPLLNGEEVSCTCSYASVEWIMGILRTYYNLETHVYKPDTNKYSIKLDKVGDFVSDSTISKYYN